MKKLLALSSSKDDKQFNVATVNYSSNRAISSSQHYVYLSDKDKLHKVLPTFLVENQKQPSTFVLKITEAGHRWLGLILVIFFSSATIVQIDVLLGTIFNKCQTNNFMKPTVSIHLYISRICVKSHVIFCYCTDLFLVTYTICRDVVRHRSNIYDGAVFSTIVNS